MSPSPFSVTSPTDPSSYSWEATDDGIAERLVVALGRIHRKDLHDPTFGIDDELENDQAKTARARLQRIGQSRIGQQPWRRHAASSPNSAPRAERDRPQHRGDDFAEPAALGFTAFGVRECIQPLLIAT